MGYRNEEKAFESVAEWRRRLKKQYGVHLIFIALMVFVFLGLRLSLGDALNFTFDLDNHTVESIVIAVVVAMVVAAAVTPQRTAENQTEIRTRANVLSLSLISRFIAVFYPLYPVVLLSFASKESFQDPKTYQRIFISFLVAGILVALNAVIEEFDLSKWEKKKRMEKEKDIFLTLFEKRSNRGGDNFRISEKKLNITSFAWAFSLGFLVVASGVALLWLPLKIISIIIFVFLLGIARRRVQFWAARQSGVVLIPDLKDVTEHKGFRRRWLSSKQRKIGDDLIQYYYFVFNAWVICGALSLMPVLYLVEDADSPTEFWCLVGVWFCVFLLSFLIIPIVGRIWCDAFTFDVFSFIERVDPSERTASKDSGKEGKNSSPQGGVVCLPKVNIPVGLFFPARYRKFAIERALAILNGERVRLGDCASLDGSAGDV